MKKKIAQWLLFGVWFSALPFIGSGILWGGHNPKQHFFFVYLWNHGELLLVSAGFAADAVGEAISIGDIFPIAKQWAVIICISLIFLEGVWFAALQSSDMIYPPIWITAGSLAMLLVTLLAAAVCKIIAALAAELPQNAKVTQ